MAHFCDNCNNLLDVTKSARKEKVEKIPVNYEALIKKIENGETLQPSEIENIDMRELMSTEYYVQANGKGKIRKILMELIENNQNSDDNAHAFFVCTNCGYTKQITSNIVVFSKNSENMTYEEVDNFEVYRNMVYQSTIPRTRNFKCPNSKCNSKPERQ